MNKYTARAILVSDLEEIELITFHKDEEKYKHCDNWFGISQNKLSQKYVNGFYDEKVKLAEKQKRNQYFEDKLIKLLLKNNVFSCFSKLYEDKETGLCNKKEITYREFNGADIPMHIVQRIDDLVLAEKDMRICRDADSNLSLKANNF